MLMRLVNASGAASGRHNSLLALEKAAMGNLLCVEPRVVQGCGVAITSASAIPARKA
jgi:hypothetical protein